MKQIPKISEAEWEVMKLLWSKNPLTANKVVDALSRKKPWKPKTVKTLLNRLATKEAIGYDQVNREYHYYPLVREDECRKHETTSFIKRIYGGAVKPMIAAFIENEKLSAEDIEELKQILEKKRRA